METSVREDKTKFGKLEPTVEGSKTKEKKTSEECLDLTICLFKKINFWKDDRVKKPWYRDGYFLFTKVLLLTHVTYVVPVTYWMLFEKSFWAKVEEGVENMFAASTVVFVLAKIYLTLKHQREIENLKNRINSNLRDSKFLNGNDLSVFESCLRREKIHVSLLFLGYATAFSYIARGIGNILSMTGQIQSIYSPFLFLELSVNSGLICVAMYKVTLEVTDVLTYLGGVFFLLFKVGQLLMYCWYGEILMQSGSLICEGIYFRPWEEHLNKRSGQTLVNFIISIQRPVQLKGGSYIKVSLTTMTKVMHLAYSFFALLRSFKGEKKQ